MQIELDFNNIVEQFKSLETIELIDVEKITHGKFSPEPISVNNSYSIFKIKFEDNNIE